MTREEAWRRTKGYLYDALSGEEADEIIKTLEQEPTTNNNLGVDCVSRQEVDRLARIYLKEPTDNHVAFYEDFLDLPSVTPQEPILDKIFCIVHPLSIMSTPELEHKAIMQIAEMLEPLCLPESEG